MNAALVNAIAERMWRCWEPLKPIEQFVIEDATAAAEAVADFVAALPHGYTAPDVLAAIRGEDTETTGAGEATGQADAPQADEALRGSAARTPAPVPDPYFLLRDHVASVVADLRAEAVGDEVEGVWEEGYSDALADILQALGVPA